jgi:hypothetical protein
LPRSALDTTREDDPAYQVLAVAEGYGIAWVTSNAAAQEEVTLRLVKDAPVKGRILDADGRPFAGARLTITGVADPKAPADSPAPAAGGAAARPGAGADHG